jgi:hypothetical protein
MTSLSFVNHFKLFKPKLLEEIRTMKKTIAILAALFMVMGLAGTAMAAFQVEVKTNSEGVTAAENACEKAGNITFTFDSGTIIQDGDWWTADLPIGVEICHSFYFVVLGVDAVAGGISLPGNGGFVNTTVGVDTGITLDNDIWSLKDVTAGDGAIAAFTVLDTATGLVPGSLFFRVRATAGSNRLRIDAYDEDAAGITAAANYDGSTSMTIGPGAEFSLKLFDSEAHDSTGPSGGVWAYNDSDDDGTYGDDNAADRLQADNDWDNTYCINVDSTVYGGSTVDVSINSGGISGNNFLSFNPSNPQVAHIVSATAITLEMCKQDEFGFVSLEGGQNATCNFDYNSAGGYCPDQGGANFTAAGGNYLILENQTGNYYQPGDDFRVVLEVSGNGAYFQDSGAAIRGYAVTDIDPCAPGGVGTLLPGLLFTPDVETGNVIGTGVGGGWDCGEFDDEDTFVSLESAMFSGIDTYNRLRVDIPGIAFDSSAFSSGDQVTVTVQLWRLPCGLIFEGERIVAEFVDECAAAAPTTTLYYPYAVALDGSQGWWFGMTIGNPSAAAGTATVTVAEMDGDIGTFTTPSIGALGLVVYGGANLLAELTPDAANAGTLGDAACHIVVTCDFASAGGFAMTGNGEDSTGYTAYGNSGTWNY